MRIDLSYGFRAPRVVSAMFLGALLLGCQGVGAVNGVPLVIDASSTREDGMIIIPTGSDSSSGYDGFLAPTTDAPDVAICGDGILQAGEQCDDGNLTPADGCTGVCTIEPGYKCPTPGKLCISSVSQACGDGKIEGGEACDDGNAQGGDGCSAICSVEAGWSCPNPGQKCVPIVTPSVCGNGTVESGEQCDDANTLSGDGCSATCKVEPHWTCPQPGQPCTRVEYCGDGVLQAARGEECDDGNAFPGDGCSGICTIELGYACPIAGSACVRIWVCGNGVIDPGETCDDGNTKSGDGCLADCTTIEPGWTCPKGVGNPGRIVQQVPIGVCGDGALGAGESCDDGNTHRTMVARRPVWPNWAGTVPPQASRASSSNSAVMACWT
jgi:cysteine-rich repeat protein